MFLIYLKAFYEQKMEETDFQLLPRNLDFGRFFLTVALKRLSTSFERALPRR